MSGAIMFTMLNLSLCRPAKILTPLLLLLSLAACSNKGSTPTTQPFAFWPPYPDEPHIQYLTSFQRSTDVEPPKSKMDELIYGKEPQPILNLNKPYGIAMWNGRIYVCDLRSACVTILDLRNHQTLVMGKSGAETLQTPTGIVIAEDGTKYVSDVSRGLVYIFDAQDRFAGKIGQKDMKPTGIAVWKDELYVTNTKAQKVEVYNRRSGQFLRSIGEPGANPGQFVMPLGLTVDSQGFVYVMDVLSCRLQKFSHDGKVLTTLGAMSANAGGFVRPKHIAVDKDGIIFVADAAFQNVQLIDQQGHPLTFFGTAGGHPGAMYLPAGVCVHEGDLDLFQSFVHPAFELQRLILVTNQFGDHKVSVYGMGQLRKGKTVQDIANSKGLVPSGVSGQRTTGTGSAVTGTTVPVLPNPFEPQTPSTQPVGPIGPAAPTTQQ